LDNIITEGKITKCDTNMGEPIVFLLKLNGKVWSYVDYRDLNAIMRKRPSPCKEGGLSKTLTLYEMLNL
jgi:hypothetical protein